MVLVQKAHAMQVVGLDDKNSSAPNAAQDAQELEAANASAMQQCSRELLSIPLDCVCPITHALMQDPVVAADGNSYERSAIEAWLMCGSPRSPLTNQPLAHITLVPNNSLKKVIRDLVECQQFEFTNLQCDWEGLANKERERAAAEVTYGGSLRWVGAPYRMLVRAGAAPLQWLNRITCYSLGLKNMEFRPDGGFQRPGEFTSLFPKQGINLRWRWDATRNCVVIDFFSNNNLMAWRWDELHLCPELRFPSTVPDFECIGHVGRFSFDYEFRSAVAEDMVLQTPMSDFSRSPSREFGRSSSLLGMLRGLRGRGSSDSQDESFDDDGSYYCPFQIGDYCLATCSVLMHMGQELGSPEIAELCAGSCIKVIQLGTLPRRIKVQADDMEGWISFETQHGTRALTQSMPWDQDAGLHRRGDEDAEQLENLDEWLQSQSLRIEVMTRHLDEWLTEHSPEIILSSLSPEQEEQWLQRWVRDFHREKSEEWFLRNWIPLRYEFGPVFREFGARSFLSERSHA
jgi:hypothetical protein